MDRLILRTFTIFSSVLKRRKVTLFTGHLEYWRHHSRLVLTTVVPYSTQVDLSANQNSTGNESRKILGGTGGISGFTPPEAVKQQSPNEGDDTNKSKEQRNEKTEENEDEEERKRRESSWKTMKLGFITFGASFTFMGVYAVLICGAPTRDPLGHIIEDEFSNKPVIQQYLLRTYHVLDGYRRLIREPSRDKLLPDPLTYPYYQPHYTLVLELTDVLVHPDWTYKTGWRFKKRPGLDYLLENLHGHFEIVIYTAEQGMTVFPLMEALDPKNLIAYKLVRDATLFVNGHHVKSLDNLNRDLKRVVVVDWNAHNCQFHNDNLFRIKRWDGGDDDKTLYDLTSFLKVIVESKVDDVREVLRNYSVYDDPIGAFCEKQKQFLEMLEAQDAARKEQEQNKPKVWTPSLFPKRF